MARQLRKSAVVELELTVDPAGRVVAAEPLGPPVGFGFDEAAVAAARAARFSPGTRDGRPIEAKTRLAIRFEL